LSEGSPGSNVVASQPSEVNKGASEEVKIPGALEKIAKMFGIDVNSIVQQYMPQLIQFIDSRIEAKLKEYMPKFAEEVRNVILDMLRSPSTPQSPPQSNPQTLNPSQASTQINATQIPQIGDSTVRDLIVSGLMRAVFGGGSITDELKKYAEIRAIAEAIAGKGLDPLEVFKIYRSGMVDTIRMLYVMTRKKFPLEKILSLEEEEEKGSESK
jgi:hypothetical protein